MEKKIITTNIGKEQDFDASSIMPYSSYTPIDEVLEWLNTAKKDGATHIKWNARTDYDGQSESVEAQAIKEEEETDTQYYIRKEEAMLKERERQKKVEEAERKTYQQLKNKFEPKS